MIELFETTLRNEAVGRILGKGYSPADYTLLCYGGGGPLHVAGYTKGVPYQQVLVPEWAAGFSRLRLRLRRVRVPLRPPGRPAAPAEPGADEERAQMGELVDAGLALARGARARRVRRSPATNPDDVTFTHMVRMQYYGQLVDIEVDAPSAELSSGRRRPEADRDAFEQTYTRMYARAASLARARLPGRPGDRQGLGARSSSRAADPAPRWRARRR